MLARRPVLRAAVAAAVVLVAGCSGPDGGSVSAAAGPPAAAATSDAPAASASPLSPDARPVAASVATSAKAAAEPAGTPAPLAGNPDGRATVPAAARPVDTSRPDRTVGNGTPASCTSAAVVRAVARGGIITFDCGPKPVTITMKATAKVRNTSRTVVLDGGGLVTLSGADRRRILYLNTCDKAQVWTTPHCDDQDSPRLTVQNMRFTRGNSTGQTLDGGGGGAIFARGGRLKIVNSTFTRNRCDRTGPDLGGAAVRALDQGGDRPVYVVRSTFSGGRCSNGGALSSIGVSWIVLNSVFSGNTAIGHGANPARGGTPGGGSGGAIYLDGNRFTLTLDGTVVKGNTAQEGGGAVFFVSNDRTGTMTVRDSRLIGNPSKRFETKGLPGIFFLGARPPAVIRSTLRR